MFLSLSLLLLLLLVLTDRPTHIYEREGDGKRNISWRWPFRLKEEKERRGVCKINGTPPIQVYLLDTFWTW